MFDETLRDNLRNITIGIGLSVVVIGTALAIAFF
jgi:hypothetical protein